MAMVKFERSNRSGRSNRGSRSDSPRRNIGGERSSSRDSGRGYGRDKPRLQTTNVICSKCGKDCDVPFKPTSNKPVYCRECFAQKGDGRSKSSSSSIPRREFDVINEKLNKIMKALNIE